MGEVSGRKRRVCGVASVPKCDFNRVALQLFWGHTWAWAFCEFAWCVQGTSVWEHLCFPFLTVTFAWAVSIIWSCVFFLSDNRVWSKQTSFSSFGKRLLKAFKTVALITATVMRHMSILISSHLKTFYQKENYKIWQSPHKIEKDIEKT